MLCIGQIHLCSSTFNGVPFLDYVPQTYLRKWLFGDPKTSEEEDPVVILLRQATTSLASLTDRVEALRTSVDQGRPGCQRTLTL